MRNMPIYRLKDYAASSDGRLIPGTMVHRSSGVVEERYKVLGVEVYLTVSKEDKNNLLEFVRIQNPTKEVAA